MTKEEAVKGLKEIRGWRGLPAYIEEPLGEEGVGVDTTKMLDMAIEALEQEVCDDCISRKRLKECFRKNVVGSKVFDELIDMQPSVRPKQKSGQWIEIDEIKNTYTYCCERCNNFSYISEELLFCPYCGERIGGAE